jgi:hypothetical protein
VYVGDWVGKVVVKLDLVLDELMPLVEVAEVLNVEEKFDVAVLDKLVVHRVKDEV